ncbi:hypothetical protein BJ508DRAFT_322075 [Ascobolus immersus RN42]|uniref:Uncharacterized protein n=1 Tax=Ascobolus immersus RN42 TaxID=1160509 RepID=A0A3N4IJU3_ASCIM|nr:hypothetical protein BJ508DRAFT_322075 [Ascobolus immersus RN42]
MDDIELPDFELSYERQLELVEMENAMRGALAEHETTAEMRAAWLKDVYLAPWIYGEDDLKWRWFVNFPSELQLPKATLEYCIRIPLDPNTGRYDSDFWCREFREYAYDGGYSNLHQCVSFLNGHPDFIPPLRHTVEEFLLFYMRVVSPSLQQYGLTRELNGYVGNVRESYCRCFFDQFAHTDAYNWDDARQQGSTSST